MNLRVLIIAGALLLIVVGFVTEAGANDNLFDRLGDVTKDWKQSIFKPSEHSEISATILFESFEVETDELREITIEKGFSEEIRIGGTKIRDDNIVYVYNYSGKVVFEDNITFNGKAKTVETGDVTFEDPSFAADNIDPEGTTIPKITEGIFRIDMVTGKIKLGDSVTVDLEDDKITLIDFKGDLILDGKEATINGTVRRVVVDSDYNLRFTS